MNSGFPAWWGYVPDPRILTSHSTVVTSCLPHQGPWQSWNSFGLTRRARSCLHDWPLLSVHGDKYFAFLTRVKHIRVSCTSHFRCPVSCTNKRQGLICFSSDLLFLWLQEQRASCVVSGVSPRQRRLPPAHLSFCFWRQTCKLTVESNPEEGLLKEAQRTWLSWKEGKGTI